MPDEEGRRFGAEINNTGSEHDLTVARNLGWTLRISSGVSEGIYKSAVQSDGEFLRIEAVRRQ